MSSNTDHDQAIQEQFEQDAIEQSKMERIADDQKAKEKIKNPDHFFVRSLLTDKEENESDAEHLEKSASDSQKMQINKTPNISITTDTPYNLNQLKNLQLKELDGKVYNVPEENVTDFLKKRIQNEKENPRYQSIYMEGIKTGTQYGLYQRSIQINNFIEKNREYWGRIANFQPLLLANGRVVPPIITESRNNSMNESRYILRTTDRSYQIKEQARVTNTPLTWMNYLLITPSKPNIPNENLIPLNEQEKKYWDSGVDKGWIYGLTQANSIYKESIRRLQVDFIGMVRFHLMLQKNIITNPVSSTVNLGVTGNDKDMNINEVLFTIDQVPQFNKNPETWKALMEVDDLLSSSITDFELEKIPDQ